VTDTLIDYDPNDTGDIPPIDDLGIEATRDLSSHVHRRDTAGEHTRNLAHDIAGLPPRRRPDHDHTIEMSLIEPPLGLSHGDLEPVSGVPTVFLTEEDVQPADDLEGPQKPVPAPRPPQPAPTEVLRLLAKRGGTPDMTGLVPALRPAAPARERARFRASQFGSRGRHAMPIQIRPGTLVAITVLLTAAVYSGILLAAWVVMGR
jgi:hypothetical protein